MESSTPAHPNIQIAQLLVKEGCLTADQLKYGLRVLAKLSTPQPVLKILLELGFVTEEQIRDTLRQGTINLRLGSLLLELGHLTETDLQRATEQIEQHPGKRMGDILIENQWVNEETVYETLSFQLGFPYVQLDHRQVDRELFHAGTPKIYKLHQLLPLHQENDEVLVAFANPLDSQAREIANRLFSNKVSVAIAGPKALAQVITLLEGKEQAADVPHESLIVKTVNDLFREAIAQKASDIHLEPMRNKMRVRFRSDGVLIPYKDFPPDMILGIVSRIKVMAHSDITEKRRHQDGRILYGEGENPVDIRVSSFVTVHGEKIVLRILNKQDQVLDIEKIGLTPRMLQRFQEEALEPPSGVIMITGPTGSGKTTTLYSAIKKLNNPQTSIITAEEPVEYVIDGVSQCSINPRINLSFEETLRHMVRQDPDVIVIGEIRDRFSAETAINAALTGHKVLTTFHTEDSIGGLLRLLNMNIEAFLISSTVVSVVAQRLVRRLCPHCAKDHQLTPHEMRRLGYRPEDLQGTVFKEPAGCSRCRFLGYQGRVGVFELLILNEEVRDALIARKTAYEIRRIGTGTTGLITLLEDGILKAANGLTSPEEIIRNLPRLCKPRPIPELRRLGGIA